MAAAAEGDGASVRIGTFLNLAQYRGFKWEITPRNSTVWPRKELNKSKFEAWKFTKIKYIKSSRKIPYFHFIRRNTTHRMQCKGCHLKKLTCKGTLRQVFICLRPEPHTRPPYTMYMCIQVYLFTQGRGGGGDMSQRERERGNSSQIPPWLMTDCIVYKLW